MKPQILSGSAVFVFPGCCLRPHGCSGRRVCFVRPGCLLGLAAVCAGGRRPAREPSRRVLLLVAPRAFRAPEDPAAREARASLRSSRASKPARALRSLRRPPHLWGWVAVVWFGASSRSPARSLRRPRAPQPGLVPRSVPYPQFRMQFPDTCSSSLSEKPGISTIIFQSMKCARGNCMRVFGVAGTLIPAGRAAGTREPGWPVV